MFPFSLPRCKETLLRENRKREFQREKRIPSKKTPAVNAQFKPTKVVTNYPIGTL